MDYRYLFCLHQFQLLVPVGSGWTTSKGRGQYLTKQAAIFRSPRETAWVLTDLPDLSPETPGWHHRRWQRTHKHTYTPTVGALPPSCARTHVIDGTVELLIGRWALLPQPQWRTWGAWRRDGIGIYLLVIENKKNCGRGMKRVEWEQSSAFSTRMHARRKREFSKLMKYQFCLFCSLGSEGWKDFGFFSCSPFISASLFLNQNHLGISSQLASWDSETFSILPVSVFGVCETWQLTFSGDKSAWSIFIKPCHFCRGTYVRHFLNTL